MEPLHPAPFPESLKATLNCYQITSIDSLSGPNGFPAIAAQMWFKENKQLPPIPRQPMVQIPYFIPNDKSAKRSETSLAGEKIACFIVGGEKRLCLPQILTSVLQEYSIAEINQACADLHIYCSRCLPEQLEILKALGILPINTAQCGLITKTDAERLAALLMDPHEPVKSLRDMLHKDIDSKSGFQVYHECFGGGYGKFFPNAYVSPNAQCIICDDCRCLFTLQRFIAHSHRSFEKRTCHWGFDPENWRSYLLLPKNLEGPKRDEHQKILDQMKARFDQPCFDLTGPPPLRYTGSPPTPSKRRYDSEQESPSRKKIKEEDGKVFESGLLPPHPFAALQYEVSNAMRHSAFRPWSPGLSSMVGPNPGDIPVIQDISHLKSMMPIGFDRRGFPQYLHNGRPVVLGSRPSEFPLPMPPDSRPIPSMRPIHSDERRKSSDNAKLSLRSPPHDVVSEREKDKNNNHHDHVTVHSSRTMPKIDLTRKHLNDRGPHERTQKPSVSPARRALNVAEVSPRSRHRTSPSCHSDQISTTSTSTPETTTRSTSSSQSSNNNNTLKEPGLDYEIKRPVSRSREAAATAMLELKSSGSYRPGPPPTTPLSPPVSSPIGPEPPLVSNAPKSAPCVVPLDSSRQHYKWSIEGQTYIVSAAGIQSLEMMRSLIETECGNEAGKGCLMHEFVKMKSLFEEKLDIEKRVRRDLEIELEQLKIAKRENFKATSETRKFIRQDMENMRQEHLRRMEELTKSQESFRMKLEETKHGVSKSDAESFFTERKQCEGLRSRIQELEMKNDKLRNDLIEEREKREDAEFKLEEAAQNPKGRISFLTESPLARMVRGVGRRIMDEENGLTPPSGNSLSSNGRRKTSTQVSSYSPMSTSASTSHSQLNGILSPSTALNGLIRHHPALPDAWSLKNADVS